MSHQFLTVTDVEVRDLALDIIAEGHRPDDAARWALTTVPARYLDPSFVAWLTAEVADRVPPRTEES